MEILVIIDGFNQDEELGTALDSEMKIKGWKSNDRFSCAYTKKSRMQFRCREND